METLSARDALWLLIQIVLGVAMGAGMLYLVIRLALASMAKANFLFTTRYQIKFIVDGGDDQNAGHLVHLLHARIPGKKYNRETDSFVDVAPGESDDPRSWFEKLFKVYYIGWPPRRVHEYEMVWDREPKPDDPKDPAHQYDEKQRLTHRIGLTDYLQIEADYPVAALGVETKGQLRINEWGTMTVRAVHPVRAVILKQADNLAIIRNSVIAAIGDVARQYDADEYLLKKNSEIEAEVMARITETMEVSGLQVIKYVRREKQIEEGEEEQALQARKIAQLRGEATKATADADAHAITVRGNAQAAVAEKLAIASTKGAGVQMVKDLSAAIGSHKGPLFLGGLPGAGESNTQVPAPVPMLPINSDDDQEDTAPGDSGGDNGGRDGGRRNKKRRPK